MTRFRTLLVDSEPGVLQITINRPDVLNALNGEVLEELAYVLEHDVDDSFRCVVLKSSGEKSFVAGADIAGMSEWDSKEALLFSRQGQHVVQILEAIPQITIARIQGFAFGGGCELAMGCDILVAGKNAKFSQPEVNLGLIPGFGGTQRLVRKVGLAQALDMLVCGKGKILSGEEAFQLGLVSRVVPDDKLDEEIRKVVTSILETAPSAVSEVKRLCRQAEDMTLRAGLSSESSTFANCFSRDEALEGMQAFLQKRSPKFQAE